MGMIRKTLSVGTLGLVSFRSKKEKLRRAERSRRQAETALESEHAARVHAESRIEAAEKRVKHARMAAAAAAAQLARTKGKTKKKRRRDRKSDTSAVFEELRANVEPVVRGGVESARRAGADASKRGRKAGKRARKAAEKSLGSATAAAARRQGRGPRSREGSLDPRLTNAAAPNSGVVGRGVWPTAERGYVAAYRGDGGRRSGRAGSPTGPEREYRARRRSSHRRGRR